MTPIKVEQTEIFKDATGDHLVCRGKLMLLDLSEEEINTMTDEKASKLVRRGYSYKSIEKPIVISETERIEKGEQYYDTFQNEIRTAQLDLDEKTPYFKVLATPDQFSQEHLQFIAEGKLNNQDQVIVECEWLGDVVGISFKDELFHYVKLTDGHIKLLPLKWIDYNDWHTRRMVAYMMYGDSKVNHT